MLKCERTLANEKSSLAAALAALLGLTQLKAAEAGCVEGAVVDGVAGYMLGHSSMDAAAGCAVGHHRSATRERDNNANAASNGQQNNVSR